MFNDPFTVPTDRFFGAISLAQVISLVLLAAGVAAVVALSRRSAPVAGAEGVAAPAGVGAVAGSV